MIDAMRSRFRDKFVAIARERLARAMATLAADDGAAPTRAELHALAGEAAMLGEVEIADTARSAETLAERWRDHGDAKARAEVARAIRTMTRAVEALATAPAGLPAAVKVAPAAAPPPGHAMGVVRSSPAAGPPLARGSLGVPPVMRTRSVLVVDDSALAAAQLAEGFARFGIAVEVAGDLGAAMAAARSFDPDVIVTDVHLPDGDGGDLCDRLRQAGLRARVWLVSGAEEAELAARAQAAGADGSVSKRVGLEGVIERVLAGR
jgi:CheY-like chemotaxis protein/HPt (histidine-containing phosphotransfer) domain-containing protein